MRRATAAFLLFAATSAFAADYGDPLPADAAPVSIATALADADAHADAPRAFSGRVGKICQTVQEPVGHGFCVGHDQTAV